MSQSTSNTKFSFSFLKFFNQYDIYGQLVPGFSLKGKNTIKTNLGSVLTLCSLVIVLIYVVSKMQHIRSVTGQTVSMYFED